MTTNIDRAARETVMSWDDPNLEPDRDPVDGRMVPCVICMASPQVGGRGVCSPECEEGLEEWLEPLAAADAAHAHQEKK